MGEGIIRQRRNLMIVSVVLWLLKYGGIKISKFQIAGFEVEMQNPQALILSIWIAFSYFLYRYYQYFSDEGVRKLQGVYRDSMERKCEPIIRALVKKKYPSNNDALLYSYSFLKRDKWVYKGHALGGEDDSETGTIVGNMHFELSIQRKNLMKGIIFSVLDSTFRNSVVTDYLLPFAVAAFILIYCGSNDWHGSFLHLLD